MTSKANEEILTQINIFDTVFSFVEKYDSKIRDIKIYGILDENNKCVNPLFHAGDIIKYIKGNNDNKRREFKKFNPEKEILFAKKIPNCNGRCNLLTKYGLIRATGLYKENIASVALREFIYALLDKLHESHELQNEIFNNVNIAMNTLEIKEEIKSIEENKNKGFVYFIQNAVTKNIKIGRTDDDVESRLMSLQTGNDCDLILLKTIECNSRVIEKQLHEKFSQYHVRGEWFNITMEQIEKSLPEME